MPNLGYAVETTVDPAGGEWSPAIPEWLGMDLPEDLGGVYPGRLVRMRFGLSTPEKPGDSLRPETTRFFRLANRRLTHR